MTPTGSPPIALVPALVAVALGGCESLGGLLSGAPRPDARVVGVRFSDLTLDAVELDLDVEVDNPYAVDLPVLRVDAALAGKGAPIVESRLEPDAPIPAEGARTFEVPVKVRFASALEAVRDLRLGEMMPYAVDLVLGFDAPAVGSVDVPVRHEGELWIPAPPSIAVRRVGLSDLSLTRIRADVVVAVHSDNAVALPLSRFDYGLRLAGLEVARASAAPGIELPANGETELVIPIDTNPLETGRALMRALSDRRVDYAVEGGLELETPFGPWSVPVRAEGTAPLASSD